MREIHYQLFTHKADSYENFTKIKESSCVRKRFNPLTISQFGTATCPPFWDTNIADVTSCENAPKCEIFIFVNNKKASLPL